MEGPEQLFWKFLEIPRDRACHGASLETKAGSSLPPLTANF
jgi:hypothetical protein